MCETDGLCFTSLSLEHGVYKYSYRYATNQDLFGAPLRSPSLANWDEGGAARSASLRMCFSFSFGGRFSRHTGNTQGSLFSNFCNPIITFNSSSFITYHLATTVAAVPGVFSGVFFSRSVSSVVVHLQRRRDASFEMAGIR